MTDKAYQAPAPRPCASCPYRRDVPSAIWAPTEYAKLPRYDRPTPEQPDRPFLCHQTDGQGPAARLCGGWVGCHGTELLALRLIAIGGELSGSDLEATMHYDSPVPLFASGAEAQAHGIRDTEPTAQAHAAAAKIRRRRADLITE